MKWKSEEENFWNRHVTAIRNPVIPAIHPRYRASYSELYGEEEGRTGKPGNPYIYLYDSVCGVCIYAE